jgi:CYTH domain-containing protein
MSTTRVFLLASALARLIEKQRGGHHVRQGFFPDRAGRSAHVEVAGDVGHLILVSLSSASPLEEPAAISRPQAEALLDLTAGRTEHLSLSVTIGSHSATIQRFIAPAPLDLISLAFKHDKTARKFQPPAWFGPEVTEDPGYRARSLALAGLPECPRSPPT